MGIGGYAVGNLAVADGFLFANSRKAVLTQLTAVVSCFEICDWQRLGNVGCGRLNSVVKHIVTVFEAQYFVGLFVFGVGIEA